MLRSVTYCRRLPRRPHGFYRTAFCALLPTESQSTVRTSGTVAIKAPDSPAHLVTTHRPLVLRTNVSPPTAWGQPVSAQSLMSQPYFLDMHYGIRAIAACCISNSAVTVGNGVRVLRMDPKDNSKQAATAHRHASRLEGAAKHRHLTSN